MKRLFASSIISMMAIILSSCGIFGGKDEPTYSSYEDYFKQELKYDRYESIDALNTAIGDTSYFWKTTEDGTCANYFSGKNILFSVYKNNPAIYVYFTDGNDVDIVRKDGVLAIKNDYVSFDEEGNRTIIGGGNLNSLNVAVDDDGFLIVAYEKYMFYVTKDLKKVYANEKNTKVFQGYEDTKTIADSDLLNQTLEKLGKDERIKIPAPSDNFEIWYGLDYYKDKKACGNAYIANTHPKDYVKLLEDSGFTVIRSFEDPYYAAYGYDGGYWYCYDEKEELELVISLHHYLYITNTGTSYGPLNNTQVRFYKMDKGYFGEKEKTRDENWSSYDLEIMRGWYDGTIDGTAVPFIKLSKAYGVPSVTSIAHSGLLDGTLAYHSKCYTISDSSPRYFLDGYDEILEANGFHKYVPNYDLTDPAQKSAFFNTEECKYVNCFINQEKNMAIKYYFDVTFGNIIRVFKLSEMKSWLTDK